MGITWDTPPVPVGHDEALEERRARRSDYQDKQAARARKIAPAVLEARRLLAEAERDRDWAKGELRSISAAAVLGEATASEVEEVEMALEKAEREVRRWTLAAAELEDLLGVSRDVSGNMLTGNAVR